MLTMKNLRAAAAQDQKRSSSLISRIRAHRSGASSSDSTESLRSIDGADFAGEHNMLATPYILTRPALLT